MVKLMRRPTKVDDDWTGGRHQPAGFGGYGSAGITGANLNLLYGAA